MKASPRRLPVLIALLSAAVPLSAQSLAEVARQEEARRKAITAPGRTYTNQDLRPDPRGSTAPAPPASVASTTAEPARPSSQPAPPESGGQAAPAPVTAEGPKDESFWRKHLQGERDALRRAQILGDALQSRINALATDFVNRDDPAQRAGIATDRQSALAELERIKQEIAQHTKAIATVQEEARRAGVPAGWVR